MDLVAVSSLVIALSTAIGYLIHQLHLRNCECCCIKSDCMIKGTTPPSTPPLFRGVQRGHPADPDQRGDTPTSAGTPRPARGHPANPDQQRNAAECSAEETKPLMFIKSDPIDIKYEQPRRIKFFKRPQLPFYSAPT